MKKYFDIVIFGNSLKSAIYCYKATKAGLKVAQVKEKIKTEHTSNESFILFKKLPPTNPITWLKQVKLIKFLKKTASHLLLSTEIEEYRKLSFISILLIQLNNLFSNKQVRIIKVQSQKWFYQINYQSYKISVNRLATVLFKSQEKSKYEQFHCQKTDTKTKDGKFSINIGDQTIEALSTLTFNSENITTSKCYETFFLTYPNDTLKLEKTLIWKDKNVSIRIIPWFEWIYFEVTTLSLKEKSIEENLKTIRNYFPSINLIQKEVLTSGIIKNKQTEEFVHTLSSNNQIFKAKSSTLAQLYLNSEKIINKILKKQVNQIKESILIGSDFKIPYHPLQIMEYCDEKYDEAKQILRSPQYFKKLFYRYGTEIDKITYQAYEYWNKTKDIKKTWLKAEIWYVINYESCTSVKEFFNEYTEEWMSGDNNDIEFIKNAFTALLKKS